MEVRQIELENGTALGIMVEMHAAPLIIVKARHGFVMCGYLDVAAASKMGDAAGRVSGVRSIEDVLSATVAEVSEKAREGGAKEGMSGREFLNRFM